MWELHPGKESPLPSKFLVEQFDFCPPPRSCATQPLHFFPVLQTSWRAGSDRTLSFFFSPVAAHWQLRKLVHQPWNWSLLNKGLVKPLPPPTAAISRKLVIITDASCHTWQLNSLLQSEHAQNNATIHLYPVRYCRSQVACSHAYTSLGEAG